MTLPIRQLRTLLVLGRVSNVPTVWSNCLAAWLLNGGGPWSNFLLLCLATTLLYIGGMFLNDSFDAEFDREFRKERPIPSGQIKVQTVWLIGSILLLSGWLLTWLLGTSVAIGALLLVTAIVVYDAVHKRTAFAPLLMALCRLLLYITTGLATLQPLSQSVLWHGLALAAYVTGLSYFARSESKPGIIQRWPMLLLFTPLLANAFVNPHRDAASWIASGIFLAWLLWCLRGLFGRTKPNMGRVVAGLLAGIVWVDASTLPRPNVLPAFIFAGLFGLALLLQRKIPAT